MRIAIISDTHTMHDHVVVPDADVLVVAGDVCGRGDMGELIPFCAWLSDLPHKHKVMIAGNHDGCLERVDTGPIAEQMIRDADAIYLRDSSAMIDGVKFYGSPWQPEFFNWSFNLPRGPKLAEKWAAIPDDTEVLITHGPPFMLRDYVPRGEHVGCEDLRDRVDQLMARKLKIHAFGHIHYSYGIEKLGDTTFANAAICTENYKPVNAPIVVDI